MYGWAGSEKILSVPYLRNYKVEPVCTWWGHWLRCRCSASWCDLALIFILAMLTQTFKILPVLYLGIRKVQEVDTSQGYWTRKCRCVMLWCNLALIFDRAVVTLMFKILFVLYFEKCTLA